MEFDQHKDSFISSSMANQQPYIHHQNLPYTHIMPSYRNLPFNLPDQNPASTSTAPATFVSGSSSSLPQSSFRAPAHKHAHHLHSIPPREKSTRTLIIDHMLWVHGRTRFAQARAELGMTDRTGGPSSPNYIHRRRPESYEEEDEDGSEGEDLVTLKARAKDPHHPHSDEEDEQLGRQDLALARSLRLRAEGLEKVVISMLEQPPPIHPINDEEILTPPTSPKMNASNLTHPHRLPNGVRLRLALGTIINDLFARQAPPPPYRHTHAPNSKIATPPDQSPSVVPSPSDLPHALSTLAPVSGAFAPLPQPLPSQSMPARSMQSPHYSEYSPNYSPNHQSYNQSGSGHMHMQYQTRQQQQQQPPLPPQNLRPHPSQRTRSLYAVGADPDTANSPPAFRCPRHLHTGCQICVEAKSPARQTGSSNSRGRANSFGMDRNSAANSWKAMPGGVGPGGGGITGWQDGSGIGSGLLRSGVRGSVLRRKVREGDSTAGAGNTKLSKLIPRFIRLSALVAAELGREARGEEDVTGSEDGKEKGREGDGSTPASGSMPTASGSAGTAGRSEPRGWSATPGSGGGYSPLPITSSPSIPRASVHTQPQTVQSKMYEFALRPSSEWYMLLAGLLTRAALEGYLSGGWTGLQAVQCLLLVGLGINEKAGKDRDTDADDDEEEEDGEEFSSLDPDELPSLVDAVKILFPSLRDSSSGQKGRAEEEYEMEMLERLKRFYDIPPSTPDCATHMEDLAWQYPAEPVERGAVRFCEAIAKWRGKPELETYKKKPAPRMEGDSSGGSGAMTIDSLVHSNPTSPMMGNVNAGGAGGAGSGSRRRSMRKPSIDVYFTQAQGSRREDGSWSRGNNRSGNKRYRDAADDGGRPDPAKRMYQ
ncbi:hypothetical protein BDZ97DRAFT_1783990 [Flammula alnicola]|nr:hypothetical protein BDZ97DRAFT_1783990 [Flammula alnicola]